MSKIAIVFPGQGSQKTKMIKDYYDNYIVVRKIFEKASEILKYDLWDIIKNNSEYLNKTNYTQPAILTCSFAIWNILKQEKNIEPTIFAGHSLGEYSSLVCSNSITFEDGLRIVQERGKIMQQNIKTKNHLMSAIIGLKKEEVIKSCIEAKKKGIVEAANFNSYNQIVISGEKSAVLEANKIAKKKGAKKTFILPVNIASHCSLMKESANFFKSKLNNIKVLSPEIPIIQNYESKINKKPKSIKKALIKQLYSPVKWTKIIEKFIKLKIDTVIECGPNKILTQINKKISKYIDFLDTSEIKNLNKIKN